MLISSEEIRPVQGGENDTTVREIKLADLKAKSPTELQAFAETHEVENASIMRKQELMFAILKQLASRDIEIIGEGVDRGAAGRLRLPPLARRELPRGSGRHLCLAVADPPLRS